MKAKKLISLIASVTMAFSAFAAVASAKVGESKGTVTVVPTQFSDADAKAMASALEISDFDATKYGFFDVAITIKDLGAFSFTKSKVGTITKYSGNVVSGLQLTFVPDQKIVDYGSTAEEGDTTKIPVSGGAAGSNLAYTFGPTSAAKDAFPKESVTSDNYSVTFSQLWYAPLGTKVTLDPIFSEISFNNASAWGADDPYKIQGLEGKSVTLGTIPTPPVEEKKLGLTIDGTDAKKENGYIWKLGLTQENGAQADSFTADFKDSTGLTNTKTARNDVSKFFGGEGTVEFYVGLKTARTITEFKATVADSTAEGVTASDTWTAAE